MEFTLQILAWCILAFLGIYNLLQQQSIICQNKFIMATQAELAQTLRDITAQNEKSRQEILTKISNLETALENAGNTSPEVDEAVAALKASVQTDDDLNEDTPTTPGEVE